MTGDVVTTNVDHLLSLLKRVDKISLSDAAKNLNVSVELLQTWIDFLVEEEIVGVEYKFTKPIIYLNKPPEESKTSIQEEVEMELEDFKDEFKKRAVERNIPSDKVEFFWRNHLKEALNRKKDLFFREAKKRNLKNIELLWSQYSNELLTA